MKRSNRKANPWEDHYTRKARQEHYPARSVYKLKEIQSKFRIIQRGDRILDLGCAPGSWLLYAASVTGEKGRVLGIDLTPVSPPLPAHVSTIAGESKASSIWRKRIHRVYGVHNTQRLHN